MRGRPWLPGTSPAQVAMPSHCRKETPTTRGSRNSSGRHPGGEWESSPSPGSAMLTRGWPVAADTRRSGEGARLCLSRWAWNASRAHSGTGQSYSPALPAGKPRQKATDLLGPPAQQWQHLARTQPPPPTPHPPCGEGLSLRALSALYPQPQAPGSTQPGSGATRGPSLVPGRTPPTPLGPSRC